MRERNATEFMHEGSDDNDDDYKVDEYPIDTANIASEIKIENNNSYPKYLSPNHSDITEFPTY